MSETQRIRLIPVRVNDEEYARAKAMAGSKSLSRWAREALFGAVDPTEGDGGFERWASENGLGRMKYGRVHESVTASTGALFYAALTEAVSVIRNGERRSACGYGVSAEAARLDYIQQLTDVHVLRRGELLPRFRLQSSEVAPPTGS